MPGPAFPRRHQRHPQRLPRRRPRSGPPVALLIPAAVAVLFLALPLVGIAARAPWSRLPHYLSDPSVLDALRLSLLCSVCALAFALLLGVPLAWMLARYPPSAVKTALHALVLLPMVLPPTVGGVALLSAFGRRGVLGPLLEHFGVVLPFSTPGAVLSATFVALPFVVVTMEAAFSNVDPAVHEAAATAGASGWRTFRSVTLPMVSDTLVAAAVLAWCRALGEFGATLTFAGNLPGTTQTLPLKVYLLLTDDPDGATAVSLLLVLVAAVALLLLRHSVSGSGSTAVTTTAPSGVGSSTGSGTGTGTGTGTGSNSGSGRRRVSLGAGTARNPSARPAAIATRAKSRAFGKQR